MQPHSILFTDIEYSTAITQRLGDAKARESSIAMQRAFAARNETRRGGSRTAPTPEPIRIRIGLNAGEPIAEDDDLFGTAVNEAARITAAAKGGEILVSNVVRELAKGKDFLFADRGEATLKGFDEPVRLYEVRWRADPTAAQASPHP